MAAVIKKKEKYRIMILGGITGVFGAVAGAIGLYLRTVLTTSESWSNAERIPEFTNGYFGVMSGFLIFLLGTAGSGLVYPRIVSLAIVYEILSLMCYLVCIADFTLVMPYTNVNGRFAWDKNICSNLTSFYNTTNLQDMATVSCEDIKTIAIMLICIPTALSITMVMLAVTMIVAAVALCTSREALASSHRPGVELSPIETPDYFLPTRYNNILRENGGFRP